MKNTDFPYINDSPVDLSGREGAPETWHALINPFDGSDSLCGEGCYLTMNYENVNCPACLELMKSKRFADSVALTDAQQASAERAWRQSDPQAARLHDLLKGSTK